MGEILFHYIIRRRYWKEFFKRERGLAGEHTHSTDFFYNPITKNSQ